MSDPGKCAICFEIAAGTALRKLPMGKTRKKNPDDGPSVQADRTADPPSAAGDGADNGITPTLPSDDPYRNAHTQLSALMESTDDCIMIADENGFPRLFNASYARIMKEALNLTMESGIKPHLLLDDEKSVEFWNGLHRKVLSGEKFRAEYSQEIGQLGFRHFEISFSPIFRNRKVTGFVEITRDITEFKSTEQSLKEALESLDRTVRDRTQELSSTNERLRREIAEREEVEKSVRENEQHLRSLLDSASGFVIYRLDVDPEDPYQARVAFVSPSVEDILGIERDDWSGKTFFENIHPEDRPQALEKNRQAFHTNRFDNICRIWNPKKEEWVWIHCVAVGVRDESGHPTHANGIIIDITEKQKAERELKKSEQELSAKADKLEEMNAALNVLLKKREQDRMESDEKVLFNIRELIEPFIQRLRESGLKRPQKMLLEIIASNLQEIASPTSLRLASRYHSLTPKEIQVANLTKKGKSSKEIAAIIGISHRTVHIHRQNIRAKLGIKKKKTNLRLHLLSMD